MTLLRDYEIEILRNKILTQYVHKHLLLDLLSTVPFDYLLLAIDGTRYLRQFIRLLRLLKIYRINEIITLIRKHTSVDQPIFRIFLMSMIYLVLAHWFNCLLIQIAVWELYRHDRFDGKTLLNQMTALPYSVVPPAQKMTKWQLYANLLLLCICYMGSIMYGDIIPFTIAEETLGIV